MIGAIRLDGATACMTIEGATDTEVFRVYVGHVLCPTLRAGDVVIMDNLSPHKSEPTLSLIAQAGAQILFLPAYSPDLNPIEQMWSKVKSHLRTAEARTQPALLQAIASALQSITPRDAMNWFASSRHLSQDNMLFCYSVAANLNIPNNNCSVRSCLRLNRYIEK